MKIGPQSKKWLAKKAKVGFRGYPVGTVAFYGPDDRRASKAVVGVIVAEDAEPELRSWSSDTEDVRASEETTDEIVEFLRANNVHSVAMVDGIFGCPHEEGIDYPLGGKCPQCPFWANRDRYTGKVIQ
jgi:hypothetical protein